MHSSYRHSYVRNCLSNIDNGLDFDHILAPFYESICIWCVWFVDQTVFSLNKETAFLEQQVHLSLLLSIVKKNSFVRFMAHQNSFYIPDIGIFVYSQNEKEKDKDFRQSKSIQNQCIRTFRFVGQYWMNNCNSK